MEIYAAFVAYRKYGGLKELLFTQPLDSYYMALPGAVQQLGEDIESTLQRALEQHSLAAKSTAHIATISGHTPDGRVQITHLFAGELAAEAPSRSARTQLTWMDKTRARLHHALMPTDLVDTTLPYLETEGHW